MSTDYVIYGTEGSPFVRKVLVTLQEKQLAWTLEEVNVFAPPDWFVEISPARRIPVLRDASLPGTEPEVTLADSSAICGYLERKVPTPALYPSRPRDYGQALWLEEYADTLLAARIGFGLLRTLISAPQKGEAPGLEQARKTVHKDLPPLLDYLEQTLGTRQWFVAEQFGIADIALGAQLMGLVVTRVGIDANRWPNLKRFTDDLFARPSFQARLNAVSHLMPSEPYDLSA